jgi:uncharacterized membrane protein YiaA
MAYLDDDDKISNEDLIGFTVTICSRVHMISIMMMVIWNMNVSANENIPNLVSKRFKLI